jgi:BirA family biotin operon repressor/biotin-[acetyl-CoA-carboxylase] ligase
MNTCATDTPALIELSTTSSTQEAARHLFDEGAPHGTVVVARMQTAGRGRRGRTWQSGAHGLWLSMIVRGALPMIYAPRLALVAADAVADVLAARGIDCRVKWPNDVLLPDAAAAGRLGPFRKAGGLLLEVAQTAPGDDGGLALRGAILGLGLNLRVPGGGFGDDLAATAGTLSAVDKAFADDVSDEAFDAARLALAHTLGEALAAALPARAQDPGFAPVLARLRLRSATLGRHVDVDGVCGTAVDLGEDGALLVRDEGGQVHTVHAGDVAVVADNEVPVAVTMQPGEGSS